MNQKAIDPDYHTNYATYIKWLELLLKQPLPKLDDKNRQSLLKVLSSPPNWLYLIHSEAAIVSPINDVHLTKEQEGKELKSVVVNISSFLDICPTCSTTLFALSALNDSFMRDLP